MKEVNILWADELDNYESTKNIVESTNDRKELEQLEQDVKLVISRLTAEDFEIKDYLKQVECYLFHKINNIQFWLD